MFAGIRFCSSGRRASFRTVPSYLCRDGAIRGLVQDFSRRYSSGGSDVVWFAVGAKNFNSVHQPTNTSDVFEKLPLAHTSLFKRVCEWPMQRAERMLCG